MSAKVTVTFINKTDKPMFAFLLHEKQIVALTLTQIFPGSAYRLKEEVQNLENLSVGFGQSWSHADLEMQLEIKRGITDFNVALDNSGAMEIITNGETKLKRKRYFYSESFC
ncbi:hypothetical protein A7985_18055 [Pseudoalteromonas luteoviolacea]|uniref:Uncharacterized protein n=1 Tax=Pseudoalteromonas luteoviolacea TaxID=43657 RepID=A0A1C0TLS1_9GAMM|nr:hypothetical protein [Pseudoalteromonas luteoviolacea]MBQ4814324.1 hypothetical protein [Pseudoalteromonas luteoviolacea]OCQ19816.1 hypothetical protein A7985_18055 [Pseudoalteromonas luteoviolacea]